MLYHYLYEFHYNISGQYFKRCILLNYIKISVENVTFYKKKRVVLNDRSRSQKRALKKSVVISLFVRIPLQYFRTVF